MAIRRPPIASPEWLFQDFLYQVTPEGEERYIQVKWDGEVYERKSSTYDYSNPPYPDAEQRGGSIVTQLDYEVNPLTKLVTVYDWSVNWRDEWPLRLAVNYLTQCLYPPESGYVIRVAGDQVYGQAGNTIPIANASPYAFWVSEQFYPATNSPSDYLVRVSTRPELTPPFPGSYSVTISPDPAGPGNVLRVLVETEGVPLGATLYWKATGAGANPTFLLTGVTSGKIVVGS